MEDIRGDDLERILSNPLDDHRFLDAISAVFLAGTAFIDVLLDVATHTWPKH